MRVSYGYRPDGSLAWSVVNGDENTRVSMRYDHAGNTTLVHDPDQCGTADGLVSEYNAYGEEVLRVTPRGAETEFSRDWLGRMTTRTVRYPGAVTETTVWAYSDTAPNRGTLASVSHPGRTVAYAYDTCQRLTGETVIPDGGGSHTTAYTYDPASRVASVTHPSGFTVRYKYDARGRLREQIDGRGETLLRVEEADPSGRVERMALGRHLVTAMEYDTARHTLTGTETRRNGTLLQKTRYIYDGFCNLAARKDMKRNMEETFGYDRLDRLTTVSFDAALSGSASYDGLGRMTAKTAGGQSVFSSAVYGVQGRPHAVSQASVAGDPFPTACQTVDYTAFDKVSVVRQGGDSLRYTYGFDRRRARMEEWRGSLRREKLYVGSCERVTETVAGATGSRWWTFLVGPGGVYAVVVREGTSHSVHYILRDHLGSWTMVTDCDGAVEQELSYDAWGNLRNPGTWVNYGIAESGGSEPMFDRGFTGHEHLSAFGLVNMDGRVYDPVMSCFLSPDLYTLGAADPRSYNRYAYCMHNPLRYVDPSGWRPKQPAPGSTPSSGDFIREIYAYSERAYEPRDFGIHPSLMSDIDVVWMEENQLHGGGGSGAVFSDLIELLSSPIYDEKGVLLGITKEGFTGQVLIYIGSDNIDFSSLSETDALLIEGVFTFDKLTDVLSGEAKSNIWTNIVSQMEGIEVYDEVFHMSDLNENQVLFNSSINSSWLSSYTLGTGKGTIQGSDKYVYETTVENILSSIVIHEYYSHIKKNNGDNFKSHRLAYKNVINYKPLWNLTTDAYKGFVVRQLNIYTRNETGRIKVDPPYRYSYYKYKDYH